MKLWSNQLTSLNLGRFPYDEFDPSLQAWNGADTYLLEYATSLLGDRKGEVLVVNDSFGALSCALIKKEQKVLSLTDSYISVVATKENLSLNGLDDKYLDILNFSEAMQLTSFNPQIVLMSMPKSKAYLDFQLKILASILPLGTPLIIGGMTREIHNSSTEIYASNIGECNTTLAKYKARLIIGEVQIKKGYKLSFSDIDMSIGDSDGLRLKNLPGVFSSDSVDDASLLLAKFLTSTAPSVGDKHIIDCGCGNGFLGIVAARHFVNSHIVCSDESYVAITSARASFEANGLLDRSTFVWTDCLTGLDIKADIILCNPPFHQGQSQTLAIAHRMFAQAREAMTVRGIFLVVANRHLGHESNLKAYFTDIEVVARSDKFIVIKASNLA